MWVNSVSDTHMSLTFMALITRFNCIHSVQVTDKFWQLAEIHRACSRSQPGTSSYLGRQNGVHSVQRAALLADASKQLLLVVRAGRGTQKAGDDGRVGHPGLAKLGHPGEQAALAAAPGPVQHNRVPQRAPQVLLQPREHLGFPQECLREGQARLGLLHQLPVQLLLDACTGRQLPLRIQCARAPLGGPLCPAGWSQLLREHHFQLAATQACAAKIPRGGATLHPPPKNKRKLGADSPRNGPLGIKAPDNVFLPYS